MKSRKYYTDENRPEWQVERGPRHGNNRKLYARLKVKNRRAEKKLKHKNSIQGDE